MGRGELAVLPTVRCAQPMPAEFTTAQRAELVAALTAASIWLVSVTSTATNFADLSGDLLAVLSLQIRDDDLGAPFGEATADAAPMPEAPPVTIAPAP